MTILLFGILVVLNLWLAHKKQSSKVITILTLLAILIFMAGAGPEYATENRSMDYINYERRYDNIMNVHLGYNIQFGYTIIQKIGVMLGLNFFWFRFVVIAICLGALYYFVIRRYSENANYVLSFYLMYPMIIDSEQLRNFIAMTIVLCSIGLLKKYDNLYRMIYVGLVAIAATFHTAFLLYIPLIFVRHHKKNKFTKFLVIVSILLMGMMFLNNNQVPFANIIIGAVDDRRVTRYLSSSTTLGFIMPLVLTLSSIILVYWAKKISDKELSFIEYEKSYKNNLQGYAHKCLLENNFITLVFWINLLSSVFFPFFMITIQFYRLPRNLLILNIITYCIAQNKLKRESLHRLTYNFTIVASMFMWLFIDLVYTTTPDRVIIPFFLNNLFLN